MSETIHIVCPYCDAVNRLPAVRLSEGPKCGKCQHYLFNGHPKELTTASFHKHIGRSDYPHRD